MIAQEECFGGLMSRKRVAFLHLVGLVAVAAWSSLATAQLNSGSQAIRLNAQLQESISLQLSAGAVNFTLAAGSANNAGSTTVTATTSWDLKPGRTAVGLYAYFASSATALTDGAGNSIPSSAFSIADNGGTAAPLTNTVPFGGANAGLQLARVRITGTNKKGSRTDVMAFNIDLSGGSLPQLPAGTYTGTLNIQAQATP